MDKRAIYQNLREEKRHDAGRNGKERCWLLLRATKEQQKKLTRLLTCRGAANLQEKEGGKEDTAGRRTQGTKESLQSAVRLSQTGSNSATQRAVVL